MKVTQNLPEVGKRYNVNHSRKGNFVLDITKTSSDWTTGVLVSGDVQAMREDYEYGEAMTIRTSFAIFTLTPKG
jgi:hypothetical protein